MFDWTIRLIWPCLIISRGGQVWNMLTKDCAKRPIFIINFFFLGWVLIIKFLNTDSSNMIHWSSGHPGSNILIYFCSLLLSFNNVNKCQGIKRLQWISFRFSLFTLQKNAVVLPHCLQDHNIDRLGCTRIFCSFVKQVEIFLVKIFEVAYKIIYNLKKKMLHDYNKNNNNQIPKFWVGYEFSTN